jgi:hypothetical protein
VVGLKTTQLSRGQRCLHWGLQAVHRATTITTSSSSVTTVAMHSLFRVCILGASAFACSLLAGFVALYVHGKLLPSSDGAYGMTIWERLSDPFVFAVWILLVLAGSILGLVYGLLILWGVDLGKALPVIASVTTLAAGGAAALVGPPLSALVALAAGVWAMSWCRRRFGAHSGA